MAIACGVEPRGFIPRWDKNSNVRGPKMPVGPKEMYSGPASRSHWKTYSVAMTPNSFWPKWLSPYRGGCKKFTPMILSDACFLWICASISPTQTLMAMPHSLCGCRSRVTNPYKQWLRIFGLESKQESHCNTPPFSTHTALAAAVEKLGLQTATILEFSPGHLCAECDCFIFGSLRYWGTFLRSFQMRVGLVLCPIFGYLPLAIAYHPQHTACTSSPELSAAFVHRSPGKGFAFEHGRLQNP